MSATSEEGPIDAEIARVVEHLIGAAKGYGEPSLAAVLIAWLGARLMGRDRELCEHLEPWFRDRVDEFGAEQASDAERN